MNKCNICGFETHLPYVLALDNGQYAECCARCFSNLDLCPTCVNCNFPCSFDTDPSPLEKVVQKVEQIGNIGQVSHIQNPERMAITCPGCVCYQNGECRRNEQHYNRNIVCEHYKTKTFPLN